MDEQPNGTQWDQRTLLWICCNKNVIKPIAATLGVPAEAIAGIMAKEDTSYRQKLAINIATDMYAEAVALAPWTTNEWWHDRSVEAEGVIKPGKFEKSENPALIDVGPANMQIGTAIGLLERYLSTYSNDPLGLGEYRNDYDHLVLDLTGRPPQCADATAKLTAKLY
jgi:hypothetical protein